MRRDRGPEGPAPAGGAGGVPEPPGPLPPPGDPCPGAVALTPAHDGLLARVRVPGGLLTTGQLVAVADLAAAYGDGRLDVTSRANLQVRGLRGADAAGFAEGLRAAGLVPSETHERVRNIVASPLAGVDPAEVLDPRPLVRALDAGLLAEPALAGLPSKFAFAVDGGGLPVADAGEDVSLVAVRGAGPGGPAGDARLALLVAGRDTGLRSAPAEAAWAAVAAALAFLEARDRLGVGVRRLRDLLGEPRGAALLGAGLAARVGGAPAAPAGPPLRRALAPRIGPLGVLRQRQPRRFALAPVVPLGRLTAEQARGLGELAACCGGDLRLTPWRGVVLADVPRAALTAAREALAALGLSLSADDPYAGLVACAGRGGCPSALADVRGDAAALAALLRTGRLSGPRLVHWSGCAKRCAMRGPADLLLVATPQGYELSADGAPVATGLSGGAAVAAAFARLAGRGPEVGA